MLQIKRSELKQLAQNKLGNDSLESQNKILVMISTAMAAHTSYTIVGGEAVKSYEKWIELHDKLISYNPPHSSPMEHCARAMSDKEYRQFIKGKCDVTSDCYIYEDDSIDCNYDVKKESLGWCNNLKGFIPYRYMIDNKTNIE